MSSQQLKLKQTQQLALTPQLQQSINLLSMNQLELGLEVRQMLSQNFMLNCDDEYSSEYSDNDGDETPELDYNESDLWPDHDSDWLSNNSSSDYTPAENYTAHTPTLHDYLSRQILLMPLDDDTMAAALTLAYLLDERGYLSIDASTAEKEYHINKTTFNAALHALQQCQPSGIGARNLEEAINLQLETLPKDTPHLATLMHIMRRYYLFLGKDHARIQKRLKLSDQDFHGALALLRSLQPAPANNYQAEPCEYIDPEIIVHERGGISYIANFDTHLPNLSINQTYAAITPSNDQEKTLLRAQLTEAKWFINALEKRENTIRRIASIIVATQQDFFQQGNIAMRPLTRSQVAEMLNIHESTVARAVNGKYLQCKRGVFELREFFSQPIINQDGEESSVIAVKALISTLIESENKKKPLSDQKICALLSAEGHQLARRTVAKYREALNIPAASGRRQR